jgi:hypothetical protein
LSPEPTADSAASDDIESGEPEQEAQAEPNSGTLEHIDAPLSVVPGSAPSYNVRVFQERNNFRLASAIGARGANSGEVGEAAELSTLNIPTGAGVDVYYLYLDHPEDQKLVTRISLTFDSPVLAVIPTGEGLVQSATAVDTADLPTDYPADPGSGFGLELDGENDWFSLSNGSRTLNLRLLTEADGDALRVVTEAAVVEGSYGLTLEFSQLASLDSQLPGVAALLSDLLQFFSAPGEAFVSLATQIPTIEDVLLDSNGDPNSVGLAYTSWLDEVYAYALSNLSASEVEDLSRRLVSNVRLNGSLSLSAPVPQTGTVPSAETAVALSQRFWSAPAGCGTDCPQGPLNLTGTPGTWSGTSDERRIGNFSGSFTVDSAALSPVLLESTLFPALTGASESTSFDSWFDATFFEAALDYYNLTASTPIATQGCGAGGQAHENFLWAQGALQISYGDMLCDEALPLGAAAMNDAVNSFGTDVSISFHADTPCEFVANNGIVTSIGSASAPCSVALELEFDGNTLSGVPGELYAVRE